MNIMETYDIDSWIFLGKNRNLNILLGIVLSIIILFAIILFLIFKEYTLKYFLVIFSGLVLLILLKGIRYLTQFGKFSIVYTFYFDTKKDKIILLGNKFFKNGTELLLNNKRYVLLKEFPLKNFILHKSFFNISLIHPEYYWLYVIINKSPLKDWMIKNMKVEKFLWWK